MTHKAKEIDVLNHGVYRGADVVPFDSAEDLWFWFIDAQQARNDGARFVAGIGSVVRPCEPVDILKILDGLYRQRRLLRDHLLVLRHYGRRGVAPDSRRVKELRAAHIWGEALERMEPILERKGIIHRQSWVSKCEGYNSSAAASSFEMRGYV